MNGLAGPEWIARLCLWKDDCLSSSRKLCCRHKNLSTDQSAKGRHPKAKAKGVQTRESHVSRAPIIPQWPKHTFFGMPIDQRAVLDADAPLGRCSPAAPSTSANNGWDIHPSLLEEVALRWTAWPAWVVAAFSPSGGAWSMVSQR
jgi:hypothetical protein